MPEDPTADPEPSPEPDTYDDAALWAHVPDTDDGSTWEQYQDDGAFPAWL